MVVISNDESVFNNAPSLDYLVIVDDELCIPYTYLKFMTSWTTLILLNPRLPETVTNTVYCIDINSESKYIGITISGATRGGGWNQGPCPPPPLDK